MPPWKANPEYSTFLGERYLSEDQIDLIADWVENGTPQGDPSKEPPLPDFPPGSQVGEPDLVLTFAEPFVHQGGFKNEYRVFVLPTNLTVDKDIATIELRPGNREIVHHALISSDNTGAARELDAEDPKYGYDGFGGFGILDAFFNQFPGYVPGQKARLYPESLGKILPAGSDILVQMHYAPVEFPVTDISEVNIFFKKEAVERYVEDHIMLPFGDVLIDGPFYILAGTIRSFHGIWEVPEKISVISITPHMHLLGKGWEVYAVTPSGERINLIEIQDWDFDWQGTYHFDRFIVLPIGTKVHAIATYDNTANNPLNPNNPPKLVTWGEKTSDEMYFLPISFVSYRDGDENVTFSGGTTSVDGTVRINLPENKLYPVFPNPTDNEFTIGFKLASMDYVNVNLLDLNGSIVRKIEISKRFNSGVHVVKTNLSGLPKGVYLLHLITKSGFSATEKIIKIND